MQERKNEAIWAETKGRWQISVQRDGVRKWFYSAKAGRKGKLEAERKVDAWLAGGSAKDNIRFRALAEAYLASIDTGHSTAHLDKEASIIKIWLLPRWEYRKVSALTNHDYQLAVNAPAEATPPRSKRTCGHVRSTISAIWAFARSDRIAMEQPFRLKIPKAATQKEKRTLQPDDIKRLFSPNYDNFSYINHFRFLLLTGLRRGELCGLRMEDYQDGRIFVRRSIGPTGAESLPKTEKSTRTIVCTPEAQKAVLRQIWASGGYPVKSGFIFCNTRGEMLTGEALYSAWKRFRTANDFPLVSLHELRHTMISMAKSEMPLPLLKSIVGHTAEMDTLGIYGHDLDGEAETAAILLEQCQKKFLK